MSVKTIFKVLLGTIAIMVIGAGLIELFNLSIVSMQIKQITKVAARQSCILFTQETYKTDTKNGSAALSDITASDGTLIASGNFYGSTEPRVIWETIYGGSEFENFCNSTPELNQYRAIKLLRNAATHKGNMNVPTVSWDSSDQDLQNAVDAADANSYYLNMYTTVNVGIPYIDNNVANKIYQWNLCQLLSNCDSDLIQKDDLGQWCVNYKGFRCYPMLAKMEAAEYKVYNINDSSDRSELFNEANITTRKGYHVGNEGIDGEVKKDLAGNDILDNVLITTVGIKYDIPLRYEGITPIRRIFEYAWDHEVAGLSDTTPELGVHEWTSSIDTLFGGGLNGDTSGVLPTSGKLVYTLVR